MSKRKLSDNELTYPYKKFKRSTHETCFDCGETRSEYGELECSNCNSSNTNLNTSLPTINKTVVLNLIGWYCYFIFAAYYCVRTEN